MKVLINVPCLSQPGGVSNHFIGLRCYWNNQVTYNVIGRRNNYLSYLILIYDYFKFFVKCLFVKYDVIVLNPSLGKTAIKRDALFLIISKFLKIKTVVFFHGWDSEAVNKIENNPKYFVRVFNKADSILVLAGSFRKTLLKWGVKKPIYLTTTKVDDRLLKGFSMDSKPIESTILFLARIEENKGIFIILEAFKHILKKFPNVKLIVAGEGGALNRAKKKVKKAPIKQVEFLGNINGNLLIDTFRRSSIYVLPTTHGEGMPTSVIEAMAFGLPVITRPVGGINDFFENEKMGYLMDSLDPKDYANALIRLIENPDRCSQIGEYNHNFAKEHFLASKVVRQLENLLMNG
ncbi:glycosyltransferase family 4 protein [Winogradskyella poriferorum]|uniref:glycosyltransferase family 4 protein n=1 Tax=Winogradskyella poriferorum TaxID=307627 RepID=UPI003D660D65